MSDTGSQGQGFEASLSEASETVAEFEEERTMVRRLQHLLHANPSLVPFVVLVISIVTVGLYIDWEAIQVAMGWARLEEVSVGRFRFFSGRTMALILDQVQIVGILALAQSLIVLTAGIDLSVGAIAVFSSVVMGQFTFRYGIPPTFAVMLGLAVGTSIGALSGWLVSRIKLPPFIVTLGMWQIVLAGNYLYSRNETIRPNDIAEQAALLHLMGWDFQIREILGYEAIRGGANIPLGVVLMLILAGGLAYALRSTPWGRHVYAVGDDPEAAELAGVNTRKTLMSVYILAGLICAVAGWVMIGRLGSVSPSASTGQIGNIQAITAVVIGGISLFGGRGSILGALFGALIVNVFQLGLPMAGFDSQWTFLLIGILIIGAVTVDQEIRKVSV
ncbi:Fructose ABC transporter, permease component FrcC [Candidatus Rhodobacter oscarellae]|uniref:Fructose ABC transporter, permease component FrcC n=1 Tax=Candidatus Rhodobacter oscarellae TaxID=1675527 RepID=A0A0J9ECY5_9RHOB|nr:ABC transporter permease [Candidatus Rhodobacter lobularis]KMW59599.1 Fructose ABC transporter, permease component FrcC [Candidatus Rhodobacter lobularis]